MDVEGQAGVGAAGGDSAAQQQQQQGELDAQAMEIVEEEASEVGVPQQQAAGPMQHQQQPMGAGGQQQQTEGAPHQRQQPAGAQQQQPLEGAAGGMEAEVQESFLSQLQQAVDEVLGEDEEELRRVPWSSMKAAFLQSAHVAAAVAAGAMPNDGVAQNPEVWHWTRQYLVERGVTLPGYASD